MRILHFKKETHNSLSSSGTYFFKQDLPSRYSIWGSFSEIVSQQDNKSCS